MQSFIISVCFVKVQYISIKSNCIIFNLSECQTMQSNGSFMLMDSNRQGRQAVSGKLSAGGSPCTLCLATPPTRANATSVTAPGPLVWMEAVLPDSGHAGPGGPEPVTHCRPWPVLSVIFLWRASGIALLPGAMGCSLACWDACPYRHYCSVRSCSGTGSV
jgi:hypothetical protein